MRGKNNCALGVEVAVGVSVGVAVWVGLGVIVGVEVVVGVAVGKAHSTRRRAPWPVSLVRNTRKLSGALSAPRIINP